MEDVAGRRILNGGRAEVIHGGAVEAATSLTPISASAASELIAVAPPVEAPVVEVSFHITQLTYLVN